MEGRIAMAQSIVDSSRAALTHRERFRRQMHYQTIDRGVHWEFGYLQETMERWHTEGLPAEIMTGEGPGSVEAYFGVDPSGWVPTMMGIYPDFTGEVKVIEKKEHSRIVQLPNGTIQEEKTDGIKTIPHYLKFPISNRDDWKRFKERLNPATPERHKVDWKKTGEELRRADVPVGIWFGSFFGTPRDWIGFEQIALMVYDDRELIEEIVETITQLVCSQLEIALREVQPDFAAGWEDICFRNGPILSPQMFSEIVIPRLKRVIALLRQHGCDVIWTDCDGDIRKLVPLWLDAGLNCMFPLEVHPGSDPVWMRKEYGKRILLRGGLAKYELAKGRREIIAELKRVEKVFADGGYIPHGDHRIPEDVPYDNYKYYIKEKLAMMGWKPDELGGIGPLQNFK
jgi:uroporphyrinogen decarboxylase